jgi:serine/threonine protein kinase
MKVSVQDSTSRKIGRQLPKYRIFARVGQGQFGQVFCAVERQTGQLVALKEITHRRLSTSKFLRELGSLLTLQHPNIVTCRAVEATPTARYLVMDYCQGGTLRDLLEQDNSLNLKEALTIMQGVLAGLEQAHRQKIIHCDIKPENILLGLQAGMWLPRLSDFGIARRLSEIGQGRGKIESADGTIDVVGAPAYTSPEAFYGMYSQSSDIYAMGIVLFELLLGYRPFSGMPERLMWAHLNQPLEISAVLPEPLQVILKQALAKLKGRRYGTAAEMSEAIAQVMNHPQMQKVLTQSLPFRKTEEEFLDLLHGPDICMIHQENFLEIANLSSGNGYLYGTIQQKTLLIWPPAKTQAVAVNFVEPIQEICPTDNHCLIGTRQPTQKNSGSIYCLSPHYRQPHDLLHFERGFTLAADPIGQWLVVAVQSKLANQSGKNGVQLRFYSLGQTANPAKPPSVKLWRSVSVAVGMLPQLVFLDRRHLLAVWRSREPKKPQTIFKIYSRRGTLIGSVRSPILFEKLIASDSPGILFGITHHPRPAVWRIQLMPLQLMRIPLVNQPTCLCPIPGGCLLADDKGQIILLDRQGQDRGTFQFGFQPLLGLGSWGSVQQKEPPLAPPFEGGEPENLVGLAGVTAATNGSCISFIKLKPKQIADTESFDD